MQIRLEQLQQHLSQARERGLKPFYTLVGDEPLLQQEAGDAVRAAAREAGCSEREVHHVAGAHFDWSGVLGSVREMSLFADAKIVEIRIPSGKPGKDGSEALQRLCEAHLEGVVVLVTLPRLDNTQFKSGWFAALDGAGLVVRIDPVERAQLPAWIARRLAAQGQRVVEGEEGQRTLAFFADRVEGNLLAAHQEISKLGLLYPPGELSAEQVESAVLNVARYDIRQWCEALWQGQAARAARMLQGLKGEGESVVSLHWQLSDDLRALKRLRSLMAEGMPMPMALSQARIWGPRQRLLEQAVGKVSDKALDRLLLAASQCDGLVKGLPHPQWPREPWEALERLMWMVMHFTAPRKTAAGAPASWVLSGV